MGYSGKTDQEISDMLNTTYAKVVSSEVLFTPPVNRILAGLESAPNAVDKNIVAQAKVFVIGT